MRRVKKLIISMEKVGKFFIVLIICENILKLERKFTRHKESRTSPVNGNVDG